MASKILFIFEGERTEGKYIDILKRHILKEDAIVTCSFANNIYNLFKKIEEDSDLDTFSLLKSMAQNRGVLSKYTKDSFSEIYLFFDYDGHDSSAREREVDGAMISGDLKLQALIKLFNNETENGKLYISYPMVEAFKHMEGAETFKDLQVKCKGLNCTKFDECKERDTCIREQKYKQLVGNQSLPAFNNLNKYEESLVKQIISAHLFKMNFIVNNVYEYPEQLIEQSVIFDAQLNKYIIQECPKVAVLSAFPIFIHDYYGNTGTKKILELEKQNDI
ncbi:MAG: hypothetical protein ACRC26_06010 [Bacteroidales bacterium]